MLYSDHPTAAIEADGALLLTHFGVTGPDALLKLDGYIDAFALVSSCAASVDCLAARYPNADEQVGESLRLLRRMLDDGEPDKRVKGTQRLVEARLRASWPADQQAVFDTKKEILDWRDFFVSYTNRDAAATNQQFRQLIKSCLGMTPRGTQNDSNYLARVITRHLRRYQGLCGFFDEDNLKVGENINHQVDQYCTKAFAFVQLIEPLTFDREPPRNWCYYEYSRFSANPAAVRVVGDKDRHFFILTDSQLSALQPASPYPPYAGWFNRIGALKQAQISLDGERNATLRSKVKQIAAQILALRAEIVDAWLTK